VDDLVVVMDELREAHHVAVEVDEGVHLTKLDITHAVIDFEERQASRGARP